MKIRRSMQCQLSVGIFLYSPGGWSYLIHGQTHQISDAVIPGVYEVRFLGNCDTADCLIFTIREFGDGFSDLFLSKYLLNFNVSIGKTGLWNTESNPFD